jgi:hypothetical protein
MGAAAFENAPIEGLENLYNRMLNDWKGSITRGNPAHFTVYSIDLADTPKAELQRYLQLRKVIFLGRFYDTLHADPRLASTLQKAAYPLLQETLDWIQAHPMGSREEFISDCQDLFCRAHLNHYLKTLGFIELVRDHPGIADKIEEDSVYCPHELFRRKKMPPGEIIRECAREIVPLYTEELLESIIACDKYVADRGMGACGKYAMPKGKPRYVSFTLDATEADIDNLLTEDTKRELFFTLSEYLAITNRKIYGNETSAGTLRRHKKYLFCTNQQYAVAKDEIRAYAINGLLHRWKQGGPPTTALSRMAHLRATVQDNYLAITDARNNTIKMNAESKFFNTTKYLPYLMHLLRTVHDAAIDMADEKD